MNDSIYVITHQTSASSNGKNRREGCENLRQSIYSLCHYAFIHYICHYGSQWIWSKSCLWNHMLIYNVRAPPYRTRGSIRWRPKKMVNSLVQRWPMLRKWGYQEWSGFEIKKHAASKGRDLRFDLREVVGYIFPSRWSFFLRLWAGGLKCM